MGLFLDYFNRAFRESVERDAKKLRTRKKSAKEKNTCSLAHFLDDLGRGRNLDT